MGNLIPHLEMGQQRQGPPDPSASGTTVLQGTGGISHAVQMYVEMKLLDLFPQHK